MIFYNIWREGVVPVPHPSAKFHHLRFRNLGLLPTKSSELVIFGINLLLSDRSPNLFFKFDVREGVPGLHPRSKLHHCGFRNVGLLPLK